MALSQDEQRVLAEIERRLAAEDPRLASSLATFRRPSPAALLRSPRARIVGTLFSVLLVAAISLMFYATSPFRDHGGRAPAPPTAASQGRATIAATGTAGQLHATQQAPSAGGGIPVHRRGHAELRRALVKAQHRPGAQHRGESGHGAFDAGRRRAVTARIVRTWIVTPRLKAASAVIAVVAALG